MREVYAVQMLDRIRRGASLLRPRSLARMAARLDAIDKRAAAVERGLRRQMLEREDHDRARRAEADAAARNTEQLSQQVETLTSSIASMSASFESLQDELRRSEEHTSELQSH